MKHRFVYTHGDKSPEERVLLTPIIAKGYVYPLTQKHGSISKKLVVRLDFVRVCQYKKASEDAFLY